MLRSALAIGSAVLACALTPGVLRAQDAEAAPLPPLLVIVAHPDDEVIVAPALARIARSGRPVHIAFATSGDAGPGESGLPPGSALARLREDEARCSARALGIAEPDFWDLGDGQLASTARETESPANRALANIRQTIAVHRPGQIITFGPDGGYGHSDHRMVSALVAQAVQEMTEARPELLFAAIADGTLPPIPELRRWATTAPDLISHSLLYEPRDLAAANTAIGCYESQFSPQVRAALAPVFDQSIWQGTVKFRSAL